MAGLKFATLQNGVLSSELSMSTFVNVAIRRPLTFGSGNWSDILLSDLGWMRSGSSTVNISNSITVTSSAIENGTNWCPTYRGGLRTWTINAADQDVQGDVILPSALSQSMFVQGTTLWLKQIHTLSTISLKYAVNNSIKADCLAGTQVLLYDAALTTMSTTDAPGLFTWTGVAPGAVQSGYSPVVLGHMI